VVFLGASSTFAFMEPMEFWNTYGVASYDFATSNLPPQCIKYCLKEIVKTQSPKLIVIDLKTFVVAEDGYYLETDVANMDHEVPLRNIIDNMKYSQNRLDMIENCVPDTYDKSSFIVDLLKYHTEWSRLLDAQSLAFARNESSDYAKGFKLQEAWKSLETTDYSNIKKRRTMSDRLEEILQDLLDYCKEEDLPVLFVANPYNQKKSHKQMFNHISDVIEENGFTFLNTNDYRDEIGLDFTTDYYDKDHVNVFGADKYTSFITAYLMEHYDLPDHRGESAYQSWDDDYVTWSEEKENTKAAILEKIEAASSEAG
jgi:hypothetical protein